MPTPPNPRCASGSGRERAHQYRAPVLRSRRDQACHEALWYQTIEGRRIGGGLTGTGSGARGAVMEAPELDHLLEPLHDRLSLRLPAPAPPLRQHRPSRPLPRPVILPVPLRGPEPAPHGLAPPLHRRSPVARRRSRRGRAGQGGGRAREAGKRRVSHSALGGDGGHKMRGGRFVGQGKKKKPSEGSQPVFLLSKWAPRGKNRGQVSNIFSFFLLFVSSYGWEMLF
ncbi:hypothetical protein T484DRAFT_1952117 [Baffinella frigidus]|nr:hypothetical protein T484DRAFT_1952117 [Cryptophyta sp. CCMP2293]